MPDDRSHLRLCDWNLYPDDRDDPELCNLSCADQPEVVWLRWKLIDERALADDLAAVLAGLAQVVTEDVLPPDDHEVERVLARYREARGR